MNASSTIDGAREGIDSAMTSAASVARDPVQRSKKTDRKMLPAYAQEAGSYERRTAEFQWLRRRLVGLLPLRRGDVVLDVGCGTGMCLPLLEERVGAEGTVVAIDCSPDMLVLARGRAADSGWRNVVFVKSAVEDAEIPLLADAVLFCAVHDILRSPRALQTLFRQVRPGAWVAAGGGKWAPPWMVGLNLVVYGIHQPYVSSFAGFDRPWRLLEDSVEDLQISDVAAGGGYLALGRARAGPVTQPEATSARPAG